MSTAIANDSGCYRLYAICVLVIATHFGVIAWFGYQKDNFKPIPPPPRLLVQTISLGTPLQPVFIEKEFVKAKSEIAKIAPMIESPKVPDEKISHQLKVTEAPITPPKAEKKEIAVAKTEAKKPLPTTKPEPKKPVPIAKVETKPKPDNKTPVTITKTTSPNPKAPVELAKNPNADAAAAKKKKLLTEVQNNLKLASAPSNKPTEYKNKIALAAPPKALANLQSETSEYNNITDCNNLESNYGMELTSRLKRLLKLPQYGDVDIQLTLLRSGKVAKLIVINSQNALNKDHVEKMLPTLNFPPFGNGFAGEEQHTFKIRLSNDLAR